jgi:Transglutaminase-like superfamily
VTGWLGRVRVIARLNPWTAAEVLILALRVEHALRRHRFEQVLAVARKPCIGSNCRPIDTRELDRAIRLVYRLLPFEATCLKHSLIFCLASRRRGLPAELRIGVQKHEGVFAAHAWVEDEHGNVLTDPQEGFSTVPLPRPPIRDAQASD